MVNFCRYSQTGEIDLSNSTALQKEGLSVAFTCFHCPSVGWKKDSDDEGDNLRDLEEEEGDAMEEAGGGGEGGGGGGEQADHRQPVFIDPQLAMFNAMR